MKSIVVRAVFLLMGLSLPVTALAQSSPPPTDVPARRIVLNTLVGARVNPMGAVLLSRAGYQARLYQDERPPFRDNFFFLGAIPLFNPSGFRVGPVVEIQPMTVFNLRLSAEYVRYSGTAGFLQSYSSANAESSDTVRDQGMDEGLTYATAGMRLAIEPVVQMKVGPVAVRNSLSIEYWDMNLRKGDRVFYDAGPDTLTPGRGLLYANDLDVIYLGLQKLAVGARYSMVKPKYSSRDLEPGESLTVKNGHHRVGLVGLYTFYDEGYTTFNKPTILLNVAWYLQHRYRTGVDVSRGVPYLLLGFSFQTDLLNGGSIPRMR